MMEIRQAKDVDAGLISNLAHEIWPVTYKGVISDEQIYFMLGQSYSVDSVEAQMANEQQFFILDFEGIAQGFAGLTKASEEIYKLQKLYVHQNIHGKGAGKLLITFVEDYCRKQGAVELQLNVNRNNKAKVFYGKMGYQIIERVDIPYYSYILNDYIMSKSLV